MNGWYKNNDYISKRRVAEGTQSILFELSYSIKEKVENIGWGIYKRVQN